MASLNTTIETVVLINRTTGESTVRFESPMCSANSASELWWEIDSPNHVLYHQDDFYDPTIQKRRATNNMISPFNPKSRLVLIGQVWGVKSYDQRQLLEIARSQINAKES